MANQAMAPETKDAREGTTTRRGGGPGSRTKTNLRDEDRDFISSHPGLSKSTLHARWVHSPEEHEQRKGQTLATRSHEVIRTWAERRGAQPATIEGTGRRSRAGVLRLDFPGFAGGASLKTIPWEDWFRTFDERELVFIFQEHRKDGRESNFFRLDSGRRQESGPSA